MFYHLQPFQNDTMHCLRRVYIDTVHNVFSYFCRFIDLDQIIAVQDQSGDKQDKNNASFSVIVGKRKYELMAHDTEEKQK